MRARLGPIGPDVVRVEPSNGLTIRPRKNRVRNAGYLYAADGSPLPPA